MHAGNALSSKEVFALLETVKDPEIPALSVLDMGIVRDVSITDEGVTVTITPTYSGCPAMKAIEDDIISQLRDHGLHKVIVKMSLSPAWTTDWLSEEGKKKLKEYGIAPPLPTSVEEKLVNLPHTEQKIRCPFCSSDNTKKTSQFGSTPCKAFYFCDGCHQPFEYFKHF